MSTSKYPNYPYLRFRANTIEIRIPDPARTGRDKRRHMGSVRRQSNETEQAWINRALVIRDKALAGFNLPIPNENKATNHPRTTVIGPPVGGHELDIESITQQARQAYYRKLQHKLEQDHQDVTVHTHEPFGLCLFSDLHLGNPGTDVERIFADAEVVRKTPGMYALLDGDLHDNWIVGSLTNLQRNQAINRQEEIAITLYFLDQIADKLLVAVDGNHDGWTDQLSGLSFIQDRLRNMHVLHDSDEVFFRLNLGEHAYWNILVRHKYKGSSNSQNMTHAIESAWNTGQYDFDIGIGAHIHTASICRPFIRQGKVRLAIQLGSYKRIDSFARRMGYPPAAHNGSGVIIFFPNGMTQWFEHVPLAAAVLPVYQQLWRTGMFEALLTPSFAHE